MKLTVKIALGGVLGALSIVFLLLTVFPYATYALAAFAGLLLVPVAVECGRRWAVCVYIAVSLLALLLVPDMEAKILFVLFFGYYPIVKSVLESLRSRAVEWLLKLLLFNAAVIGAYALLMAVGFSTEAFAIPGVSLPMSTLVMLFLLAGNITFILYDFAASRLLSLYFVRIQPRFRKMFKG